MKVTILQGLPGSGKSTYVKKFLESVAAANDGETDGPPVVRVVSADAFFMHGREYRFDPAKLPQAHAACLKDYVAYVQGGMSFYGYEDRDDCYFDHLFVDNTNTTVAEVAPYYALAQAFGDDVEILYFPCDPETAAQRNTHGVPLAGCQAMAKRLEEFEKQMPPWWTRRVATAT